jgi:hypothetical protein
MGFALSLTVVTAPPRAIAFSLIQQDLFFGRNISTTGQVSEAQFRSFLDTVVTPRFPDGLTVFDAKGQFRDNTGAITQEPSKLVTLFVTDDAGAENSLREVTNSYLSLFSQQSVLQVTNRDNFNVIFEPNDDLFLNSASPKFIELDLLFGRDRPGGIISESEFQNFIDSVVTPRFPDGLTLYDASGQFKNSAGAIIQEPSKDLKLLALDTIGNENAIREIIDRYLTDFQQESVLLAVNGAVDVLFGASGDLFPNSVSPKFIEADLFFGRAIPTGIVSEEEFQNFVDTSITPLFPDGLTVFDVSGQFKNNSGTIIREPSKNLKLLFEDTIANENSLRSVINNYIARFQQEGVLSVLDRDVSVTFNTLEPTAAVPEGDYIWGLLVIGGSLVFFRRGNSRRSFGNRKRKNDNDRKILR